jgi:hypothetical protein
MSNNAIEAYREGKLPLSKITRSVLTEHGIDIPVDMFKWLCKTGFIKPCERHHTSMEYHMTDFYDLKQASNILKGKDVSILKEKYKNQKKPIAPNKKKDNIVCFAHVSYKVRSGPIKRRTYRDCSDYAILLNGWAYLVSGGKKIINGKNFHIIEQYKARPEQITEDFMATILNKQGIIK